MNRWKLLMITSLCAGLAVAASTGWTRSKSKRSSEARTSLTEMKQAFGTVPTFIKTLPDDVVTPAWQEFRDFAFAETAIPGKYKQLIALGVAAQIPCDYCTYADTKFAKLQGASDDEVAEAVLTAATVRRWSTFMNGLLLDEKRFSKDIDRMLAHAQDAKPSTSKPAPVDSAKDAMADVKRTFGFVPEFIKEYPRPGLAGAWNQFKVISLDPNGAIPPKYRELTGLAVAAQIPCRYCVIAHTKSAKAFGASDDEIAEAVALAGMTRQWSTVLNGMQINKKTHRREVDAVVKRQSRR